MSAQMIEKMRQAEAGLKKVLAGVGDDAAKRRSAAKAVRRAQRKRRKLDVAIAKHAPKPKTEGDGAEG